MAPLLSVDSVTKRFGAVTAVDTLSASVAAGEIVALLGPNGAGKTTLIRMVVGLIRPDEGKVIRTFDATAVRARGSVGYLPEERGLYQDMPVLKTLIYFGGLQGMPPRQASEVAASWLERLGLASRGSDKVKALSKGNQQKVQFAAAILHKPKLAILDEPFSGLDPLNQEVFLDLIRELRDGGTTVIFSAHQMTLVERLADRLILMSHGREVFQGSIAELRRGWHTGDRVMIGTTADSEWKFLESIDAVASVDSPAQGQISLRLKPGASMSELLRVVGEKLDVTYLRTEETTLHEIYIRTVEADGSPRLANSETPHE